MGKGFAGARREPAVDDGTSEAVSVLLRGRSWGIEVALDGGDLGDSLAELESKLSAAEAFYRDCEATLRFGEMAPSASELTRLQGLLSGRNISIRRVLGGAAIAATAEALGAPFEESAVGSPAPSPRREPRRSRVVELSESARSLKADFDGARADIASRRRAGETSVRRLDLKRPGGDEAPSLRLVEAVPGTLYHVGTLRGGQSLQQIGNIVVVGDVNPGAELIASGDILVFGRLAGVAHAGAQGDSEARVRALELVPTQLRIATAIAAESSARRGKKAEPETACVRDGKIVVVPCSKEESW
uniref:Septum formation inhibitor MinC C-terminal domain-containing protein n=1 Tax=mine drainage metagenome TaxID=410659 RepID=E6Q3N0_9ZZZZ